MSSYAKQLLPVDAVPLSYNIKLIPDLKGFTFQGSESIKYAINKATDTIHLHSKDLMINSGTIKLQCGGDKAPKVKGVTMSPEETTLAIQFDQQIPVGSGELSIEFSGTLNDQMAGFYRSGYMDIFGRKKYMATTQLEPIDARRMFPCVDEPAAKATFKLAVRVPGHLTAISNMPESKVAYVTPDCVSSGTSGSAPSCPAGERQSAVMKDIEFMESPKMSTYLLALCVGDFECLQTTTARGTLVRVLAAPGKASQLGFSLDVAKRALEYYETFFNLNYPLPKMDMIAIPDFAMGAMENWGLVTYREIDMLVDEKVSSSARLERVASVITHELAHQWFGNLVTMEWWDDLWLNEGFATFMQTLCADTLFPKWRMWDQYVLSDLDRARNLDSLRSSHPIQVPIPRGEDVEQVFDAISYSKGACVVRVLYHVLGADCFREGLRLYMKRHAYGNTVTTDLWTALQEAYAKQPQGPSTPQCLKSVTVAELMRSWTEQMGYPVVRVSKAGPNELKLTQEWFLADGSVKPEDANSKWVVPIFVGSSNSGGKGELVAMLTEKSATITLPEKFKGASWIKVNFGEVVPMRVQYDDAGLLQALVAAGAESAKGSASGLSVVDCTGLLLDLKALCRSGRAKVSDLLRVLKSVTSVSGQASSPSSKKAPTTTGGASPTSGKSASSTGPQPGNVDVWESAESCIASIDRVCAALGKSRELSNFVMKAAAPQLEILGWENKEGESSQIRRLRNCVLRLIASYIAQSPSTAVFDEADRRASEFVKDQSYSGMSDDTRQAILRIVLSDARTDARKENAKSLWTFLKKVAENPATAQATKLQIYGAEGFVSDSKLKTDTLEWALSDNIRTQDFTYPLAAVKLSGLEAAELSYCWMRQNFPRCQARVAKASPSLLAGAVSACCSGHTRDRAAEINSLFGGVPSITRSVAQISESVNVVAACVEREKAGEASTDAFWTGL